MAKTSLKALVQEQCVQSYDGRYGLSSPHQSIIFICRCLRLLLVPAYILDDWLLWKFDSLLFLAPVQTSLPPSKI